MGRQNDVYEEPRKILQSLKGLEYSEMERSRETAQCCGGGGAGLVLEMPRLNIDKARADQINEVHPDVVAVACPHCYQMLDAAIGGRNYNIEVRDIAELVIETI